MASSSFTLTRNLKLRLDSNLTASARSNLEKIDLLGSTFLVDSANTLRIRSSSDISIEPESPDLGGSALGGTLSVGNASQYLSSIQLNASNLNLTAPLGLQDQAVSPTSARYLRLRYNSGLLDITADRTLTIDPQGASRNLILGGSYSQLGGSLALTLTGDSTLTLPLTGTLATLAGLETLTNKSINADTNFLTNIRNSNVAANAGITYSRLNLTGGILNSDVANSAAIDYYKLNLAGHIQVSDLATNLALPYSYTNLNDSIRLSDLYSGIQIPGSYIVPMFLASVTTTGQLGMQQDMFTTSLAPAAAPSTQASDLVFHLPPDYGTTGQVLATDGFGHTSWVNKSTGGSSVSGIGTFWVTADGVTKTFTHSLGTTDIAVEVEDVDLSEKIWIDRVLINDLNSITLTSSEAPVGTWRITVTGF